MDVEVDVALAPVPPEAPPTPVPPAPPVDDAVERAVPPLLVDEATAVPVAPFPAAPVAASLRAPVPPVARVSTSRNAAFFERVSELNALPAEPTGPDWTEPALPPAAFCAKVMLPEVVPSTWSVTETLAPAPPVVV